MGRKPARIAKKKKQRPPVTWRTKSLREMTPLEIKHAKKRLEEGWKSELPTIQLYTFTGLDEARVNELKRRDPELAKIEESYKNYLRTMSRISVARDILEEEDVQTAKWYLEHIDDEFKPSSKIDVKGAQVVVPLEKKQEELEKLLSDFTGASFDAGTKSTAEESEE